MGNLPNVFFSCMQMYKQADAKSHDPSDDIFIKFLRPEFRHRYNQAPVTHETQDHNGLRLRVRIKEVNEFGQIIFGYQAHYAACLIAGATFKSLSLLDIYLAASRRCVNTRVKKSGFLQDVE